MPHITWLEILKRITKCSTRWCSREAVGGTRKIWRVATYVASITSCVEPAETFIKTTTLTQAREWDSSSKARINSTPWMVIDRLAPSRTQASEPRLTIIRSYSLASKWKVAPHETSPWWALLARKRHGLLATESSWMARSTCVKVTIEPNWYRRRTSSSGGHTSLIFVPHPSKSITKRKP